MNIITRSNGQLMDGSKRFRGVGFNYYPFVIESTSQSTVQSLMNAAVARSVPAFRTWCFDASHPPVDGGGNFRYPYYPLGTNLLSTNDSGVETSSGNWTLGADASWSMEEAYGGTHSLKNASTSGFSRVSIPVTVTADTDYVWTFWRKTGTTQNGAPVAFVGTSPGSNNIKDGGFIGSTSGVWKEKQITFNSGANTTIYLSLQNFNGIATAYYDDIHVGLLATPEMREREATYAQLDMVLNEAYQRGLRVALVLADNPTYDTKENYVELANLIYDSGLSDSSPWTGFFDSDDCRTLFKEFFDSLANRVNTINGMTYKNDPTILYWELGNELRYDLFDAEGGTQNTANSHNIADVQDWIVDITTHMRTVDPNHLIHFGDMGHTWQWVNGDTVSNGSGYGVDYNLFGAMSQLDAVGFHIYPNQSGTELKKFGQRLGFPNAITGGGYRAQVRDYVRSAHANSKPCICGEIGFDGDIEGSTTYAPLHPRHEAFKDFMETFLGADGDLMFIWHATVTGGGSYSVGLADSGGETVDDNSNDTKIMALVEQWNYRVRGRRIPVDAFRGIST